MPTSERSPEPQYLIKLTKFGASVERTADRNETFTTTGIHGACVVTVWEESLR